MNISNIAITLRPRTGWQSIDLGFKLGRQWFLPLFLLWCMLSVPVYLLCKLVGFPSWLVLLGWWWFKPLYEAPLYFWCSRAVFSEPVSLRQALAVVPRKLFSLLATYLLFWRLGTARSQNMSVIIIENLKGKGRSARLSVISRVTKRADPLIFVCVHIEVALAYSIMLIAYAVGPAIVTEDALMLTLVGQADSFWLTTSLEVCIVLAAGVVAPFYVCSGFSLYINRRTHLEAWDIDLQFRRLIHRQSMRKQLGREAPSISMKDRQPSGPGPVHNEMTDVSAMTTGQGSGQFSARAKGYIADQGSGQRHLSDKNEGAPPSVAASIVGVFSLICCLAQPNSNAIADATSGVPNDRTSHLLINEILEHKDFGVTTTKLEPQFIEREEKEEEPFSLDWDVDMWGWVEPLIDFFKNLSNVALWIEGLLWILVALLFASLAYLIVANCRHFTRLRNYVGFNRRPASQVQLFDLDIAPKSLPADIPSAARNLLNDGHQREAMSLLYRGALSRLVHRYGMNITESATERQCVELVNRLQPSARKDVFAVLTRCWLQAAYGRRGVSEDQVSALCDKWSPAFDSGLVDTRASKTTGVVS